MATTAPVTLTTISISAAVTQDTIAAEVSLTETVSQVSAPVILGAPGPKGDPGIQGEPGESAAPNVFIQDDSPGNLAYPYLWTQTNYGGVPGKTTQWLYTPE